MPGAFKLDHLQPFKPILFWEIFNFFTFILGSQFLLPQRANYGSWENFPSPNMDKTEGFQCLGHSNWTICSPLSPLCSEIFPNFSLSYRRAHSYFPRGLKISKRDSLKNGCLLKVESVSVCVFLRSQEMPSSLSGSHSDHSLFPSPDGKKRGCRIGHARRR